MKINESKTLLILIREFTGAAQEICTDEEAVSWLEENEPNYLAVLRNITKEIESVRTDESAGMLAAYQKAFNAIDDLMEYRGMDKEQFSGIAKRLTEALTKVRAGREG